MSSTIIPKPVKFYAIWNQLPEPDDIDNNTSSNSLRTFKEDYEKDDYTNDQLKNMILSTTGLKHPRFPNITFNQETISRLPAGALLSIYNHFRYGEPMMDGLLPVVITNSNSNSYLNTPDAVSALILFTLMARVINKQLTHSVDLSKKTIAINMMSQILIAEEVLGKILSNYETIEPSDKLVLAQTCEMVKVGQSIVTNKYVYINSDIAERYVQNGHTYQSIAEQWVAYKTTPSL